MQKAMSGYKADCNPATTGYALHSPPVLQQGKGRQKDPEFLAECLPLGVEGAALKYVVTVLVTRLKYPLLPIDVHLSSPLASHRPCVSGLFHRSAADKAGSRQER